tara:strand:+ start:19 stop:729 length:711 start_codon:yes stop_codon:yes gene_type:complete
VSLKNWDNKTWLSSKNYILNINKFLLKFNKLNSNSKILDIGCGRGKISGALSSKLKLKNKPIGIDLVNHKDKDKRINFKKIDALSFFSDNNKKFDLILVKQTIHFLKFGEIKILLREMSKSLNSKGKIFIFMIDPYKNEIPNFVLMKKKMTSSLNRDKKILSLISMLYPKKIIKDFSYKVKVTKKEYIKMIKKRFISILLNLNNKQISDGIDEINLKYSKILGFNDKLICIIIKNI